MVAVKQLFDVAIHEEEASILSILSHKNIVGYRCESTLAHCKYLVTEFMPNGTLYEVAIYYIY